jgi:CspA family cold shock protein
MATGTVKWFSDRKGYGFILPDEGGPDLFVHYTGIAGGGHRTLVEGVRVEFDVRPGRKGSEAFDVVRIRDRVAAPSEADEAKRGLSLAGRSPSVGR